MNNSLSQNVVKRFSPGRLEWLGNHTDYNNGVALSVAIDLGITIEITSREDDLVLITSENYPSDKKSVLLREIENKKNGDWSGYVLGVVALFHHQGYLAHGLDIKITSTLPEGAGISSSAALECATGLCLVEMTGAKLDLLELAKLCQMAEHKYVGTQCGLLDQISSLAGKKDHALVIDFNNLSYQSIPFSGNHDFIVFPSGAKHALVDGEYNERKASCEGAAKLLGVSALASVSMDDLLASRTLMSDRIFRRALHIVGEVERVNKAVNFLKTGNAQAIGQLMYESHESSIQNFENSHPALDAIVEWLRLDGRICGARLTGGGFGGSVLAFCEAEKSDAVISEYIRSAPNAPRPIKCKAHAGGWILAGLG